MYHIKMYFKVKLHVDNIKQSPYLDKTKLSVLHDCVSHVFVINLCFSMKAMKIPLIFHFLQQR